MSLRTGLVRAYNFNGDSIDVTTNFNGVNTNVSFSSGLIGQAAFFNGTSSKINISKPLNANAGTISFWAFPTASGIRRLFSDVGGYCYFEQQGNAVFFRLFSGGNRELFGIISASTWNHIVGVWDGVYMYLYINGVLQGTTTCGSLGSVAFDCFIGSESTSLYFQGGVDIMRIYDRGIAPSEVSQLYNNGSGTELLSSTSNFFPFFT